MNKEKKLETVLYNAISLLIDETFGQYDDSQEWFEMIFNELNVSREELMELGIEISISGGIDKVTGKNVIKSFETSVDLSKYSGSENFDFTFPPEEFILHKSIFTGNKVIFVDKEFTNILLPHVYVIVKEGMNKFLFARKNRINMDKKDELLDAFKEEREERTYLNNLWYDGSDGGEYI